MNIIELLNDLANCLPNDYQTDEKLDNLPQSMRAALRSNDNEILKSFISGKTFYANEVKVTIY